MRRYERQRGSAGCPAVAAALLAGCLLAWPSPARAAACCISAGVFGVGRLVVWEEFAVGTGVGVGRAQGLWDQKGSFRAYGDAYSELEAVGDLYAIGRLDERFQGFARLPYLYTRRSAGGVSEHGSGFGDLQAGLRFEPVQIGEYEELPAIALTFSVLAPTGTRPEDAVTSFATGTSGRGVWAVGLGVSLEEVRAPWFVRLDAGGSLSRPFVRKDLGAQQAYGPTFQLGLFAGRELLADRWVLALGVSNEWEAPLAIDGTRVADSGARSPALNLSTSWKLGPHWMVQASALATPWLDGLGKNRLGRFGGTVGLRYGYF